MEAKITGDVLFKQSKNTEYCIEYSKSDVFLEPRRRLIAKIHRGIPEMAMIDTVIVRTGDNLTGPYAAIELHIEYFDRALTDQLFNGIRVDIRISDGFKKRYPQMYRQLVQDLLKKNGYAVVA